MRSIFLMVKSNLKNNKIQNLLVSIIIMISVIIFSTSIILLSGISGAVIDNHEKLNGFDEGFFVNESYYDLNEINKELDNSKYVDKYTKDNCSNVFSNFKVNKKRVSTSVFLQAKKDKSKGIDKLKIIEGSNSASPKDGEVWVASAHANANNIKVGDYISVYYNDKNIKLKVSAIVNDPLFNCVNYTYMRLWVNEGYLEKIMDDDDINEFMSISLNNYKDGNTFWSEFNDNLSKPISGMRFSFIDFLSAYDSINSILGSILLILSILMVLFTVLVVMFTTTNMILMDSKKNGVLESLGFSKSKITSIYVFQFALIVIVMAPIGALIARPLSKVIINSSFSSLGLGEFNPNTLQSGLISICIVLLMITIGIIIGALKIRKIDCVQAIRFGTSNKKSNKSILQISRFKKANLNILITIKDIFSNKMQSIILVILLVLTFFISAFSINVISSLRNMGEDSSFWGFEKADVSIKAKENIGEDEFKEIVNEVSSDKDVEVASQYEGYFNINIDKYKDTPAKNFIIFAYDKKLDDIGMTNIEGRNPKSKNEVSIAYNTSKTYDKKVGDYITLTVNGREKEFKITGIYQSLINLGQGVRMDCDALSKYDPNFKIGGQMQLSIILKNSNNTSKYMKDLKDTYGDKVEVVKGNLLLGTMATQIISIISLVCVLMIVIFVILAYICISNFTIMNIHKDKKCYGIYKVLGYTEKSLAARNILKIILLSIISMIIAIPIVYSTESNIMGSILTSYGAVSFPITSNIFTIILVFLLLAIILSVGTLIPSKIINKITIRDLISE